MPSWPEPLASAYATCEVLARSHYENFPVASLLLPPRMRPHVAAVYAFARVADDVADEGREPADERQARLDVWQRRLHDAAGSEPTPQMPRDRDDLLFMALGHTIRTFNLPVSLFDDLLSAFRQDTMTNRYDSWSEVFDYCRRSANPVGRLVLRLAGRVDQSLDGSSDALCTALQLTNFWQDFGRDWRAGRLYAPRDVAAACGADESDLIAGRMTSAWTRVIEACTLVTRAHFDKGRAVCDEVGGRLGLELRLTWTGGMRILEEVERRSADLLHYRPALGAADLPPMLWRVIRWTPGAA